MQIDKLIIYILDFSCHVPDMLLIYKNHKLKSSITY